MSHQKAVIYARQSSGKEEESESIAMQLELCRELAAKHGLNVVGEFHDANSSGRLYPEGAEELVKFDLAFQAWYRGNTIEKKSRPGLRRALELLGQVDYLLVYDMTRLYRPVQNSFLQGYLDSLLVANQTRVLTVKEGENNPSDFSDSLVSTIKSHVNDNQIRLTSEKSRLAMAKLKDSGYLPTGARMFGIRYVGGRDRRVEVVPAQAEVIRFVFQKTLELKPFNWIVRAVNEHYGDRLGNARCFYKSSFRSIISQPFYCGYMRDTHGALIVARQMQGQEIVSYSDWQKANDIVGHNAWPIQRRKSLPHPFSGILVCGYCGAKMQVGLDGDKEFYQCPSVHNAGRDDCRQSRVTINLLRQSKRFTGLQPAVQPLLLLALRRLGEHQEEMRQKHAGRAKVEHDLRNYLARLEAASEEYLEGRLPLNTFTIVQEKANAHIQALQAELLQVEHAMRDAQKNDERIQSWLADLPAFLEQPLPANIFEELLRSCVKTIRCFHDAVAVETIYGSFTLPRQMVKNARNFPRFTYQPANALPIRLTYHYGDHRRRKRLADFPGLEIFMQD